LNPGPALPFDHVLIPDTCGLGLGSILLDTIPTNSGGGTGDYIYTFDGATYAGVIESTGLSAGTYEIGLTDTTLGCSSDIIQITLTEVVDVVDESFDFDDFCSGDSPIPTNIATVGGTWGFNPAPTDGATINSTTGVITGAVIGNSYSVEYTVGICSESSSVLVTAAPVEDATFTYDPLCLGSTPAITVVEAGGTWSFNPDPGTASIDAASGEITGGSGTFEVQYITAGTCPDSTINTVIVYDAPAAPLLIVADSIYCPEDVLNPIIAPTGTGLTYSWFDDQSLSNIIGSGDSYTPFLLVTGQNSFYLTASDPNGCVSLPALANYYLVDISAMTAIPDLEVCIGSEISLSAEGGVSYQWTDSGQIVGGLEEESATAKIVIPEDFYVEIVDEYGCRVVDTVSVSLLPTDSCNVTVYNAFSPNDDGKNDFWEIDGIEGYPENTVVVFNRWGDVIIDFQNYDNSTVIWGGENRAGKIVPAGTYFFVVEVGGSQDQSGWVQVVK
jgi:gliding motility-associated-like protein